MIRRIPTIVILIAAAAGAFSCGLFETRDPVEPKFQQFPCYTLTLPNNVFVNILQAYGLPIGLGCYVSTLADSTAPDKIGFRFHADPADSSASPAQFASWSKAVEERVAENIANAADLDSTFDLNFGPFETITSQADVQIRRYPYEIIFRASPTDTFFQGLAEIRVDRGTGGEWQVTDWVDRRDPNGTTTRTWGYLRGSYRIGF